MTESDFKKYFPNITPKRKSLFKDFYKITFINDLPVTDKNRSKIGFHPLVASYVIRHILWEILNCPGGNHFLDINHYSVNKEMLYDSKNIFEKIYKEGIKDANIIFKYDSSFITGNSNAQYSGLTNVKMLYIYSYYNLIVKSPKYTIFCEKLLNSLTKEIATGGCSFKFTEDILWIDEEANYPNFILNGFLSIIRNLIDLTISIKNLNVEEILLQNKNAIEYLLPLFDCEKYLTSKYRLCSYGQIKFKVKSKKKLQNKLLKVKIIYDNKYKYLCKCLNCSFKHITFKNLFNVEGDYININFIFSEILKTQIEISFIDNDINIVSVQIGNYSYKNYSKCFIDFKNIKFNFKKENNKIVIDIPKNVIDNFQPSITYFTKKINNNFHNVYHYNHITNLKYINKYFNSDIIKEFIVKWETYTEKWKDFKLYNNIKNVNLLPIN
jgi:hypothetical protein